jgi:hypothetical protein
MDIRAADLPDGTGPADSPDATLPLPSGAAMRDRYEAARAQGRHTWALALLEEVAEALDETDPDALRAELVQVAAVALRWIDALDRRRSATEKSTTTAG